MDVIQLHQHGIDSAVATLGTALTPEQARIIKRVKNTVIISYDSDEAGQKATKRAIELLNDEGLKVRVLTMNGSKDPDEYIKSNGVGAFRKLIDLSEEQILYKIKNIRNKYDISDPAQKSQYVSEAAAEFTKIKSPVECEIYVKKLSAETDVSAESIFSEIARIRAINEKDKSFRDFKNRTQSFTVKPADMRKKRCVDAQKLVLNILCYNAEMSEYILKELSASDFDDDLSRIFDILMNVRKKGDNPDAGIIVSEFKDPALAAEVLHDDKNIEDVKKATLQSVKIIAEYRRAKGLEQLLKSDGLSSDDKLNRINEVVSNKGKGVQNGIE